MTGTFAERRLIPLMRFLLLGFPPLRGMRRTRRPGFEVDLAPRDDAWMNSSSRRGGSVHAEDYQVL
ncbi:MAG: hypothetical protein CMJ18_13290 [Phycisphaeraceae bacterium]|nr:hypothetical protein [Phycisphaeraceae bacterium]